MSRCAYTIHVGPASGRGEREVSLLHRGQVCFSTTHCRLFSVLIANFPVGGSSLHSRVSTAFDTTPKMMPQKEEYLCVFHKDELQSPSEVVSSSTIVCSSYNAASSNSHQLSLSDFSVKSCIAGVYGVFIHGYYTYHQRVECKIPIYSRGSAFCAAEDVWWMASPTIIKPIYVQQEAATVKTTGISATCVKLNATVIAEFEAFGSSFVVLVHTKQDLLLASLEHSYPRDAVLWRWHPQTKISVPGLHNIASLTATISSHPSLDAPIIFLHDNHTQSVTVLKSPSLRRCDSPLVKLQVISQGVSVPPILLPCVSSRTPQPVLVANYPSPDRVSLLSPFCPSASSAQPLECIASLRLSDRREDGWKVTNVEPETDTIFGFTRTRTVPEGETSGEEVSRFSVHQFPFLSAESYPLLHHVLDVIAATLGDEAVWEVENDTIAEAWKRDIHSPLHLFDALRTVLLQRVEHSLTPQEEKGRAQRWSTPSSPDNFASDLLAKPNGFELLTDPLYVRWETVEAAVQQSEGVSSSASLGGSSADEPSGRWDARGCGALLFGLHLLYESAKLQESLWSSLLSLVDLNLRLSVLLGWEEFREVYRSVTPATQLPPDTTTAVAGNASPLPFEALQWGVTTRRLACQSGDCAPMNLLVLLARCFHPRRTASLAGRSFSYEGVWLDGIEKRFQHPHPILLAWRTYLSYAFVFQSNDVTLAGSSAPPDKWWRRFTRALAHPTFPVCVPSEVSIGAAYPLLQAMHIGKTELPGLQDVSEEELRIVGRIDFVSPSSLQKEMNDDGMDALRQAENRATSLRVHRISNEDDGVDYPPEFPQAWTDTRLERAQYLMNTSAYISVSDAEVKSGEKSTIESLRWRAEASTVGRGVMTMRTHSFRSCDCLPIPKLNLNGMTETGIVVVAPKSDPSSTGHSLGLLWPLFHNSCSAAIRFFPLSRNDSLISTGVSDAADSGVTREKIIYQWRNADANSRAGVLFAAGLLGHLTLLQLTDVYSILVSQELHPDIRELSAVAVLLGLASSYCGTNNPTVFKCLSVHILSLTPSDEDVEIRLNVQTAAFVSVGLLCQAQYVPSNAFLLDVFLVEMTRLPSDEHCMNREGYSLGAGIGLGLMLLGSGRSSHSASLVETLIKVMEGGLRESSMNAIPAYEYFLEKPNHSRVEEQTSDFILRRLTPSVECSRVHEGKYYNVQVVGPAAVMAVALIFLKTGDELLAQRVAPPSDMQRLHAVSPIMCLLRCLASSLVRWSMVTPSSEWLYNQLPSSLNALFLQKGSVKTFRQQRQYFMLSWGHCIAGTCMALGLRFAGTMNSDARQVILKELKGFMNHFIGSSRVPMTPIQKATGAFDSCLMTCCIAASVVMAGTGDMQLFVILQTLFKRPHASYGAYMAYSMSMGLLFLGGGRLTLSNATPSVAALLIALYPVWPMDSQDNVKHLQALRHLYTLAVVPRVVEAVDAVSQRPVSIPLRVVLRKGHACVPYGSQHAKRASGVLCHAGVSEPSHSEEEVWLQTPCLYPPAEMIERIEVCSPDHHSVSVPGSAIPFGGLQIRVLAKPAEETGALFDAITDDCTADRFLTPVTKHIVDWLRRLNNPQTSVVEAIAGIENVKLILAFQRTAFMEALPLSRRLLSYDILRGVQKALESRYANIFQPSSSIDVAHQHPLHMLFIQRRPLEDVVHAISQSIGGSAGFPCDCSFLCSPNNTDWREARRQLSKWLEEFLCYYGLNSVDSRNRLGEFFHRQEAELTTSALSRSKALLRLQQSLHVPYRVLQDIAACCFR